MKEFETVVGLEIHAHLKTESKMFCRCATGPKGKDYKASEKDEPNIRNCPVCTGQPGTLPVPNKKAIEDTILLGLALGSKIAPRFNFERKNYFYPDLPKAYQITSATNPPVIGGGLEIDPTGPTASKDKGTEYPKLIELDHIHLEEDAGKLTHHKGGEFSLVDLNRGGTPLLEIITRPVLSSGAEAVEFMKNLQAILRYLNISDADMEKGQMRCDANISIRKIGAKELGVRTEVKNLNSFKMVARAIAYEAERQASVLTEGGRVKQETRGWDDNKGKTLAQRSKEFANDYRYFPEPDIPPIETGQGKDFDPEVIKQRLPELPQEKTARFIEEYGLPEQDAHLLAANLEVAKFYEETLEEIPELAGSSNKKREAAKATSGLMITELIPKVENLHQSKISPKNLAKLMEHILKGEISLKIAKEILSEMLETGKAVAEIIKDKGIKQISDAGEIEQIIGKILSENPAQVAAYKSGKEQLFGFFVGQVMKATSGQANPSVVNKILKENLK